MVSKYSPKYKMALINMGTQYGSESKTNLIVNYLPQDMTERDLYMLFHPYGSIASLRIVRDRLTGYSYGYGFVNYDKESSAYKAINLLNGLEFEGKKIKVSFARPSGDDLKDTNLYISNLPRFFTEEDLEKLFKPYGRIVQQSLLKDKFTGDPRGVAFVRYNKREEAALAMKKLSGKLLKGSREPLSIKVANAGKNKSVCHHYAHTDVFASGYLPYPRNGEYVGRNSRLSSRLNREDAIYAVNRPFMEKSHHDPLSAGHPAELSLAPYYSTLPHTHDLEVLDEYGGPLHLPVLRGHDYVRPSYRYHPIRPMYSRTCSMSIAEYEYECSRAELLGARRPTWEEFIEKQKLVVPQQDGNEPTTPDISDVPAEDIQELGTQGEKIGRVGGGLEELNTILASTQHKINKFKTVCGSFTNLMKLRGWKGEAGSAGASDSEGASSSSPATPQKKAGGETYGDMEAEVSSQVDRLDSLINKAERAELSMSVQNKQMRSFLNK